MNIGWISDEFQIIFRYNSDVLYHIYQVKYVLHYINSIYVYYLCNYYIL